MQFEKGFEPGQGNTFTEIVLGPNSMYLPNVTSLTINNGVVETKKGDKSVNNKSNELSVYFKYLEAVKADILDYVSCIASKLKPDRMNGWQRFWKGLLDVDVIEKQIGNVTKQQGTTFNRMFVCNIIRYLDQKDFYENKFNASDMARALENDAAHSIRTHGLDSIPDKSICKEIDKYIENFYSLPKSSVEI